MTNDLPLPRYFIYTFVRDLAPEGDWVRFDDANRRIDQLRVDLAVANAELGVLRMAAELAADDVAFFFRGHPFVGNTNDSEKELCVGLLVSDTFGYAGADCERITLDEVPHVYALYKQGDWPAIVRWISERRQSRPIKEVENEMALVDRLAAKLAAAEALVEYAQHLPGCSAAINDVQYPCKCGAADALAVYEGRVKSEKRSEIIS